MQFSKFLLILTWLIIGLVPSVYTQTVKKSEKPGEQVKTFQPVGFVDKNGDGINDKFMDADGDGKNDLDGKPYPHKFKFEDKNRDKINDLWIDRDGDGVNDLSAKLKGKMKQEIHSNVLDVNEDGINDITGIKYDREKHQWHGEKWGFWNESKAKLQGRFIDEDGDGIDDRLQDFERFTHGMKKAGRKWDVFIDEDGDGICDHRTDFLNKMGRMGRHRMGNKHGGHRGK